MRLPNCGATFPSKSEDIPSALEFSSRTIPPNRIGRQLLMHFEGFLHEQLEDAGELIWVPKMVLQEGRSSVFQHESSNSRKQPPTKQLGRPLRMLH